jgi:hypothetical protein
MSQFEYETAIADFLRKKNITRCPTACVVQTRATLAEADRAALRHYNEAREAARMAKLKNYQQATAH